MPKSPTMVSVPLSEDGRSRWRGEVTRAQQFRQEFVGWWDANLKKYAPSVKADPEHYGEEINTNRDFTLVERKKADLFYQRPDVSVQASPLMEGQEGLLETHAQILNEKLGPDGVNAKRLAHQVLFDVLCPAGSGFTEMGYESVTREVDQEVQVGEQPAPGDILGLSAPVPIFETVKVPVPIFERCYWSHFSPRQSLVPSDFRSTNWDDANWLGVEFEIPLRVAKRLWKLPDDYEGGKAESQIHFDHGIAIQPGDQVARGQKIYYKSALYRDDVLHPQHLTHLVFLDGIDEPVEHRDSPHQDFDANGRLTPDSLIGFPIHPLTIRVLTDAAFVPSDCTVSRPLVNELNRFREQMVEYRDASILRWMANSDTLPPDALKRIVRSPIGGVISVPGEAFAGEGAFKEMPHGSMPRENFTLNDYVDNDIARTHGIDAGQAGVLSPEGKTATEVQNVQANVNARLDFERGIVLDWYLKGVTKYSALVQRYLPAQQAAQIVGEEKAGQWDQWRKTVPASLAFTALPDAALRTDLAWERKQAMDVYSFLANEPLVARGELLKAVLKKHNLDPAKLIIQQPPEKQPEPAKPSFAFKGEDLNPLMPQFGIVMEVLRASGFKISEQAVAEAQAGAVNQAMMEQTVQSDTGQGQPGQAEHGGKQPQAETLDKHQAKQTGGMQGSGAVAPMGAGNMVQ